MDVTRMEEVRAGVEAAAARLGRLDVLVNNAGFALPEAAEDVTEEAWERQWTLNVKGLFFAAQAAARIMFRQGSGSIVNLSSQAGFVALPGVSVYCATKAAIAHLTKSLAVAWGVRGVRVNAVAPTFFDTPSTEGPLADPAFRADVLERIAALHRIGEPMEAAAAVVFLASPAAAMITGHTLMVDGGWTAR
jgi:NAD(P)-dependent dehydrogenase (short-subunit alcohol dehydrogenase family)